MVDRRYPKTACLIVLLFVAGAIGAPHEPVSGQSSACSAIPAGADAALIGDERAVFAFDNGQANGTGYDPLVGTVGTATGPATAPEAVVLSHGEAFKLRSAEGLTLPTGLEAGLGQSDFTFWITFSVDDIDDRQFLLDGGGTETAPGFKLWMQEGGRMWIEWHDAIRSGIIAQVHDFEKAPCDPQSVIVSHDGDTQRTRVYLNGKMVRDIQNSNPQMNGPAPMVLGSDLGARQPWKGKIDALHFYDRTVPTIEYLAIRAGPYCESACTDVFPPALRAGITGIPNGPGMYRSEVTVNIQAMDAGIGLLGIWTDFVDGENFTMGGGPFHYTEDGTYTLRYNATDLNENEAGPRTTTFTLDKEPPEVFWTRPLAGNLYTAGQEIPLPASRGETVIAGSPTFTFTIGGADTTTKIESVTLYMDGVSKGTDLEAPFAFTLQRPLPVRTPHEFTAVATDSAGNRATITQQVIWT